MKDGFEQELIGDLRDDIEELNVQLRAERKRATDAEHWMLAYYNMLGPIGRDVVKMWHDKKVQRVHFSWGPDAFTEMDGEQRAQFILDLETAPSREVSGEEIDGDIPRQTIDEFLETKKFNDRFDVV